MPQSSLVINLNRDLLKKVLVVSRKKFFDYLYYKTDYYFFKEQRFSLFRFFFKKYRKLTKEEAFELYEQKGFEEILDLLKDKRFKNLFVNYDLLVQFEASSPVITVILDDFKLLLDISNIPLREMILFNGKQIEILNEKQNQQESIGRDSQ